MKENKHTKNIIVLLVLAALVVSVAMTAVAQPRGRGLTDGSGVTAVTPVADQEIQWLKFMREEEKLTRDFYQRLFEQ